MIRVRFKPLPDRVRTSSVWIIDAGLDAPLLVGYVRNDLRGWIAKPREDPTHVRNFRDRREAAGWLLETGEFAQKPKAPAAVVRMAA